MPDEAEEKPQDKPDLREYLGVVRRRHWQFLLPFFLGWLAVWTASWLLPSVYRSGTLILIEQPAVPEKYVVSNINDDIQNRLDSITQQILSRTRLLGIIERLKIYAEERKRLSPDELVEQMRNDIEIELVRSDENRKLTAFNVYYSATDPHVAQAVTAELTNLFIRENIEQREQKSENTTKFLENQLDEARASLSKQEQRVREFKDQHIGELPGQLQTNLQILNGLQTQLQAKEDDLNRAKQQNTYLESLLGQYRSMERSTERSATTGDTLAPVGLPAIDKELERLKAQLADLGSHYTDEHPDIKKLKKQIAKTEKLKQQIIANLEANTSSPPAKDETRTSSDAQLRESSPMMELESQLKANQIEIANRQREITDLQARVGEYQTRLNRAPVMEQQFTDITRDYDQSRANYDLLLAKKNQSEMATDLEKTQQGQHFRMLDPPSLPAKPYSPNRLKLFGMGLAAGLVLGVGFAGGTEFLDDRLHGERALKELVPLKIIVDIPPLTTPKEKSRQMRQVWFGVLGTGVIFACVLFGFAITYFRG